MIRRLTEGEVALARSVFGGAIEYNRVRVAIGGFGGFAVTVGSRIHTPRAMASADFSAERPLRQGFLIHEMTHVWQFQTSALRTLASWAGVVATGGYGPGLPAYRYAVPITDFAALNLEQQASAVEHAFLLSRGHRSPATPPGARLDHYRGALPFEGLR